jgi:hypothetical protein
MHFHELEHKVFVMPFFPVLLHIDQDKKKGYANKDSRGRSTNEPWRVRGGNAGGL